jgi:uncharacterized membrane protein
MEFLEAIAERVALGLELLSVLVIAVGGVEAAVRSLGPWLTRRSTHSNRREAWLGFARWLLIGLEFMLAADIVRTAIAPTFEQIGQLAAIAVIRTFLNYFLERDLEKAAEMPERPAAGTRSKAD